MKLSPHIITLERLDTSKLDYLHEVVKTLDLSNPQALTKEEAFYNACVRYEAETPYFHAEQNFYSGVLPSKELAELLAPYHEYLVSKFPKHTVFRSQVVKNEVGGVVNPHIDLRLYHRLSHRIHAVLQTNGRVRHVYFDEETAEVSYLKMEAGYLYDFDNITPHAAFNLGDSPRIHVITDLIFNGYLLMYRDKFKQSSNFTEPGTEERYYKHLDAVYSRYGGKDGLLSTYERHLQG